MKFIEADSCVGQSAHPLCDLEAGHWLSLSLSFLLKKEWVEVDYF